MSLSGSRCLLVVRPRLTPASFDCTIRGRSGVPAARATRDDELRGRDTRPAATAGSECSRSPSAGTSAARRASHRDPRRIAMDRANFSRSMRARSSGPLLRGAKHVESQTCVLRSVPWHIAESGQRQRWTVLGRSVRVKTVDQRGPYPASCMRGRDADLLDVGAPVDNVAEEIADRAIGCVDRNPRVSGPNERLKLGDRQRLVSGDLGLPIAATARPAARSISRKISSSSRRTFRI